MNTFETYDYHYFPPYLEQPECLQFHQPGKKSLLIYIYIQLMVYLLNSDLAGEGQILNHGEPTSIVRHVFLFSYDEVTAFIVFVTLPYKVKDNLISL